MGSGSDGEAWVSGDEMLARARDEKQFPGCADWSQHHAEQLLARASELPKVWARSDGSVLLFPDTEFHGGDGYRRIPCLIWGVGGWQQGWSDLGGSFRRYCHFLRLGK